MAAVLALMMCLFSVSIVLADPTVDDPGTTGEDLPIVDETFMDDPHGAYINLVAEVPEASAAASASCLGTRILMRCTRLLCFASLRILPIVICSLTVSTV